MQDNISNIITPTCFRCLLIRVILKDAWGHCSLSWELSNLGKGNLRPESSKRMKIAMAGSNIRKLLTKKKKKSCAGLGKQGICGHKSLREASV